MYKKKPEQESTCKCIHEILTGQELRCRGIHKHINRTEQNTYVYVFHFLQCPSTVFTVVTTLSIYRCFFYLNSDPLLLEWIRQRHRLEQLPISFLWCKQYWNLFSCLYNYVLPVDIIFVFVWFLFHESIALSDECLYFVCLWWMVSCYELTFPLCFDVFILPCNYVIPSCEFLYVVLFYVTSERNSCFHWIRN